MMQKKTRKLTAVASGIILMVGGFTTGAANAAPQGHSKPKALAATCASNSYDKPSGYFNYPGNFPGGTWLVASDRCGAIWVKSSTNRNIKVCLGYSESVVCQRNYTFVEANSWTQLASVSGGTYYKFRFQSNGRATGTYHG